CSRATVSGAGTRAPTGRWEARARRRWAIERASATSAMASASAAIPAARSSTKWLPVAITAAITVQGYTTATVRTQRRREARQRTSAHHAAQAICSDGIAASSLACEASEHAWKFTNAWLEETTSLKPSEVSIRGGATGQRQETRNASTLTRT